MPIVPESAPGARAVECAVCGADFWTNHFKACYCSEKCKRMGRVRTQRKQKGIDDSDRECKTCMAIFPFLKGRQYCSENCAKIGARKASDASRGINRGFRVCSECREEFPFDRNRVVCGAACSKYKKVRLYIARKAKEYGADPLLVAKSMLLGCEICGRVKDLCIDHDHETSKYRGILCLGCNGSLGAFGDNFRGVMVAVDYVVRSLDVLSMAERGELG